MEQSCNGGAWLKSHSRSLGNGVSEVEVFVLVKGGLVQFLCVTKRDFSSHPFFFFHRENEKSLYLSAESTGKIFILILVRIVYHPDRPDSDEIKALLHHGA